MTGAVKIKPKAKANVVLVFQDKLDWLKFLGGPVADNVESVSIVNILALEGREVRLNSTMDEEKMKRLAAKFNAVIKES